jgi:hypothetical protein
LASSTFFEPSPRYCSVILAVTSLPASKTEPSCSWKAAATPFFSKFCGRERPFERPPAPDPRWRD